MKPGRSIGRQKKIGMLACAVLGSPLPNKPGPLWQPSLRRIQMENDMSKPKLGPWHPAVVDPVHVGVYETKDTFLVPFKEYRFFDGKTWRSLGHSPSSAFDLRSDRAAYKVTQWRGLAEKPA